MNDIKRHRADGWPICPQCDEDELYSLAIPADPAKIDGCYRCGWRSGVAIDPRWNPVEED